MSGYLLGLLTTPAVALFTVAAYAIYVRVMAALDSRGFSFEAKSRRKTGQISDYTLSHDIWWERSFGPIFVGGWYFEHSDRPQVNRWIGFGPADGPCWMAFRRRVLTPPTKGRSDERGRP